jgi:hypothetical protein
MWAFVQFRETDSSGSVGSLTSAPFTITAHDQLVVGIRSQFGGGSVSPTSLTDSLGNTYHHINASTNPFLFGGECNDLYYCEDCIGGTGTITVTFPSTSAYAAILFGEWSGIALSGSLDASQTPSGTGSGQPSIPITTLAADDLIIGMLLTATGPSVTASTLTDRSGSFLGGYGVFGDFEKTPAGTFTATTTSSGSAAWNGLVAAFKIAGGGPPPPTAPRSAVCVSQ